MVNKHAKQIVAPAWSTASASLSSLKDADIMNDVDVGE